MTKPLTIGLLAAALIAGVLSLVKVDGSTRAPAPVVTEAAAAESEAAPVVLRMAQLASAQPYMLDYERGPRIIQVPQADRGQERGNVRTVSRSPARASVERRPEPAAVEEDDDDDVHVAPAPPPRPRAAPPKPRAAAAPAAPLPPQPPAAVTPRWKLRGETPSTPPPAGPRRAVLSAPPTTAGPTPLRPTPNFDNKGADRGERFVNPVTPPVAAPTVTVTETQPPLGYSPPALPEQPSEDVPAATPAPDDGAPPN